MTTTLLEEVRAALPRRIRAVELNDPVLTAFGDDWSLTLMCPWRVEGPGWGYTWESESLEDDVWDLVGHDVVGVTAASPDLVDPVFELDGDIRVVVSADTDLDPWTLRLPNLIVVGSMAQE
jgi:hypothetical protein